MRFSKAISPLWDIRYLFTTALRPFASAIIANPSILLKPRAFGDLWLSTMWSPMGDGIDEGQASLKRDLITPNAVGVVLDIGSGGFKSSENITPYSS